MIPSAKVVISKQAELLQKQWEEFSQIIETKIVQVMNSSQKSYIDMAVDDKYQDLLAGMVDHLRVLGYIADIRADTIQSLGKRGMYLRIEW